MTELNYSNIITIMRVILIVYVLYRCYRDKEFPLL